MERLVPYLEDAEQDVPNESIETSFVVGDEEFLPIKESSLDLVISCLGLHWTNDLPGAMIQVSFFRVVMVLSIVIDVSKLKSDGPGATLCLLKCSVTQKVH
ncbi:putative methyltransferase, mitochondrial [Vitis vinifera]|uniref:Putative methyltransferase, mitochondrial n=1 Tax=Vitis vinifera TaxID=29760 RepID=A0A438FYD4_VITVI|nr:putative methyltransferase, mitochondrial [Vitis vinifera]